MISENLLRLAAVLAAFVFVSWPAISSVAKTAADSLRGLRLPSRQADEASLAVELIRRLRAKGNTKAANAAKNVLDLIVGEPLK